MGFITIKEHHHLGFFVFFPSTQGSKSKKGLVADWVNPKSWRWMDSKSKLWLQMDDSTAQQVPSWCHVFEVSSSKEHPKTDMLGGGFKHVCYFYPLPGEMIQVDII